MTVFLFEGHENIATTMQERVCGTQVCGETVGIEVVTAGEGL